MIMTHFTVLSARAEYIEAALQAVDARYGPVEEDLTECCGIADSTLQRAARVRYLSLAHQQSGSRPALLASVFHAESRALVAATRPWCAQVGENWMLSSSVGGKER